MSETKLKPCPFCGGKLSHLYSYFNTGKVAIACNTCLAQTSFYEEEQEAIEAWNRRAKVKEYIKVKMRYPEYSALSYAISLIGGNISGSCDDGYIKSERKIQNSLSRLFLRARKEFTRGAK